MPVYQTDASKIRNDTLGVGAVVIVPENNNNSNIYAHVQGATLSHTLETVDMMTALGQTTNSADGAQTASLSVNFTSFPHEIMSELLNGTLTAGGASVTASLEIVADKIANPLATGVVTLDSSAPATGYLFGTYMIRITGVGATDFNIESLVQVGYSAQKTGLTAAEIGLTIVPGANSTVGDYYVVNVSPPHSGTRSVIGGTRRNQGIFSIAYTPDNSIATQSGSRTESIWCPRCKLDGEITLGNTKGEWRAYEATFKLLTSEKIENGYYQVSYLNRV